MFKQTALFLGILSFAGILGGLVYANSAMVRVDVPATLRIVENVVGDADRDGDVDVADLEFVSASLGPIPPGDPAADIDGDGVVDIRDLVITGVNFEGA